MSTAIDERRKVQPDQQVQDTRVDLFRWQKYEDGDGQIWIITNLFGFDRIGRYGSNVEYLNVDSERIQDTTREEFESWVKSGTLRRINGSLQS